MNFDLQRTIVALSSGALPGRRAIVRLSGGNTAAILTKLFVGEHDAELLQSLVPRSRPVICSLAWPQRTVSARAYFWPDARSFTGEPCAELHVVGSLPVVESLLAKLCELGAAFAERGEFTLRSFLAGKLDLTQAEAVLGVIEANGEAELQTALSQLAGNLSRPVRALRDHLLELIAHLEAGLDFVEEDIEFISTAELTGQLQLVSDQIKILLQQIDSRDARSSTAQIVIAGLPNAGKSSLFNALVDDERAIVSEQAGTTRDVISQRVTIDGLAVELADTAGLEELQDPSPRAWAQVALHQRLRQADMVILCIDSSVPLASTTVQSQIAWLQKLNLAVIVVGTKADRVANASNLKDLKLVVSAHTGMGLAELEQRVASELRGHQRAFQSEAMRHTAVRCQRSLTQALATLLRAIELCDLGAGEELVANELRVALDELSSIIGEVHADDILGEIFSRFCIGK